MEVHLRRRSKCRHFLPRQRSGKFPRLKAFAANPGEGIDSKGNIPGKHSLERASDNPRTRDG